MSVCDQQRQASGAPLERYTSSAVVHNSFDDCAVETLAWSLYEKLAEKQNKIINNPLALAKKDQEGHDYQRRYHRRLLGGGGCYRGPAIGQVFWTARLLLVLERHVEAYSNSLWCFCFYRYGAGTAAVDGAVYMFGGCSNEEEDNVYHQEFFKMTGEKQAPPQEGVGFQKRIVRQNLSFSHHQAAKSQKCINVHASSR